MSDGEKVHNSVDEWIDENKKFFLPPICNKMMHNEGQMKLFFVGGPNQRKDFHIEAGEELFYMLKGDMVLKILEQGKHRDVKIKQGEVFLLPGRIPHSPQRYEDTIGLVIERERIKDKKELDGLRYFVEKGGELTTERLFEKWFFCTDLGSQLAPIIKEYFASEQHKTGKPIAGTLPKKLPFELDKERKVEAPFSLKQWIERNRSEIDKNGHKMVFGDGYQFQVFIYGKGESSGICEEAEIWIWQWEGESTINVGDEEETLKKNDCYLIRKGRRYSFKRPSGSISLFCWQDPTKADNLREAE